MITHLEHVFLNVFNIILPVLICAGIGYCLALFKEPFDNKVINGLISRVGFPTLVISHLSTAQIEANTFLTVMAAAATIVAGFAALSFIALRVLGYSVPVFLGPLMYGNIGGIGLPVTLLAFGGEGLAYAMGFVVVILLCMFSIGIWIPSGSISIKRLITSPVIYAAIIALGVVFTGFSLPQPIESSFNILGGLTIPLLLLTMGHTLASFQIRDVRQAGVLTIAHLGIAVVVALFATWLFGFTGTERGVVILCCLMPSSVANYLFADQYQPDRAPDVAGFILLSTLTTLLVLPLALTYWV
ncbi:transporter [Ruegeria sp. HKCCD4884]|uniref:AEC family transporter n=1 Tax=Ruegeria sp. HKCCD4884 TaxID=2683022 RepID=UPI001490DBF2|nr:AEC family transporter [Ruegeria sp. HKCCD4884]NOD95510.1 transporter [Ruegeria sp. HKCCD4884]